MRLPVIAFVCLSLGACLGAPDGVTPVKNFDVNRYLGVWYEVARLDHSFERGLEAVSAEYSLREDGGLKVLNSGRSVATGVTDQAEGRAYFVEAEDTGYLKVSFFGPFFGSYIVFDLDQINYQYAFVAGNSTDYLWLLSRTPQVSDKVMESFISRSAALGFDTEALIFVDHSPKS
ncbi:MAG: lipocalin [Porticoccaceae bacterium]|jgi:apolipoprotein D and lipocalin family protein|nr:lipocalin [Porticoccaceae bacterium]